MLENYNVTQKKHRGKSNQPRFIGALSLGAFVGIFTGLMAMALAILTVGILRLFLPELTFQIAGISLTAVIFVIFLALGWAGGTIIIWHKLSPSSSDI